MGQMDGPLVDVHEGMTVVDAAGEDVGTVERVKLGSSNAVSTDGGHTDDAGLFRWFVSTGPEVPEPARQQFLRYGYLQVDGGGLPDNDVYVRGDRVSSVSDGVVVLSVPKDRLIDER